MGVGKYLFMVIVMLVLFLSLINMTFDLPVARYEIVLTVILLFIAIIAIAGMYSDSNWGYVLGAIFFALNLLNLVYLYFRISSATLIWYGLAGAFGFLVSVASTGKEEEMEVYEAEKREEVGKEIGKIEGEPKVEVIREKPKKRAAKKKAKKKAKK